MHPSTATRPGSGDVCEPAAVDPRTPVVVAGRRTPVTTVDRELAPVGVDQLAAAVLRALDEDLRALLGPSCRVDDVVLGNCTGPGGAVARVAALAAGLGVEVPGVTVDRQCGSGLDAVRLAAALVRAGEADVVLAGGAESASTAPWRLDRAVDPSWATGSSSRGPGWRARAAFAPAGFDDPEMGAAADDLAAEHGVTRQRQDAYAARSHARTVRATDQGVFAGELVAVGDVTRDDRPRPGLSAQTLGRFRPAFRATGTVTAGSSCGVSDGAAAVAVVPEAVRAAAGLPGLRVLACAVAGVDPRLPGLGPVPAVRAVLARAGLSLDQVTQLEITEAFAAQVLACTDALGLDAIGVDAGRVCPDGGAIALGHPWGASGALLVLRLLTGLGQGDPPASAGGRRYGIAACAVGGGQGVAVAVERV